MRRVGRGTSNRRQRRRDKAERVAALERALFLRGWRLMTGYYTQENDPRRITLHVAEGTRRGERAEREEKGARGAFNLTSAGGILVLR